MKTGGQTKVGNPNRFGAGVKGGGGTMGIRPRSADSYGIGKTVKSQTPITNSSGSMVRGGKQYQKGSSARSHGRG